MDAPLPADLSKALRNDARLIAQHGLRSANEMANLLRSFDQAGIPMIFIKGLTVGKLAFRNPFLKMSWDIDLLVPAKEIPAAAGSAETAGYRLTAPAVHARSAAFERWHQTRKESIWYKADGRITCRAAQRLADNARLIPGIGIDSPRQQVEIAPGIVLPTLASEELFAYLCVHGASSAWFRLKWITDLAARNPWPRRRTDRSPLYRRSQQLGAGRAAGQALLLANGLFGTPITSTLRQELEAIRPIAGWPGQACRNGRPCGHKGARRCDPGDSDDPPKPILSCSGLALQDFRIFPAAFRHGRLG